MTHAPNGGEAGLRPAWLGMLLVVAMTAAACTGAAEPCSVVQNDDGSASITCPDGSSARVAGGRDGGSCSVTDEGDGTRTLTCDDGTSAVLRDGEPGPAGDPGTDGASCSVTQHADGSATISCEDGSSVTLAGPLGGVLEGNFVVGNSLDAVLLRGFTEVTGNLTVQASGLTTLGPQSLTRVGGSLKVSEDAALVDLTGLERLQEIGGDLWILNNQALTALSGLEALTTVGGDLFLSGLSGISDLRGLDGLTDVGGDVLIGSGPFSSEGTALVRLDGLENLARIGKGLAISENGALASLAGLSGLEALGVAGVTNPYSGTTGDLFILDNPALPECQALQLRDRLMSGGFEGAVAISGNDATAACP